MALVTLSVNVDAAIQALNSSGGNIASKVNTNEMLDAAGAMLLNRTRQRYLAELNPDKVPWLPSKAGLKRRLMGGTGTLFKTGRLFHSIQLHKVSNNERSISTDVPYAKFHQWGIRKFLGFNNEDQHMFTRVVETMLARALANLES